MGKVSRTIAFAREAWSMLRQDRDLLAIPFACGIVAILVGLVGAGAVALTLPESGDPNVVSGVIALVTFVALSAITIFSNTSLVAGAFERLDGGDPTVGSATRVARQRLPQILSWAVISVTVGLVLSFLRDKGGLAGSILAAVGNVAWGVITYLVVPVYVATGVGVGTAMKDSAGLAKRTWGENLAGNVGFGLLTFMAAIPAMVLVGVVAAATSGSGATVGVVILAALWIAVVAVVVGAMSAMFQAVLYRYATGDDRLGAFSAGEIRTAFHPAS
jgi:Family of unknown function (DUF6159)